MQGIHDYQIHLEKKLIAEFKKRFFEKLGYEPVVTTRNVNVIKRMELQELEDQFLPFLPTIYGKVTSLKNKSRKRELVELRAMFVFIAREMGHTLKSIGYHLGGRDHTSIIHSTDCFKTFIEVDDNFRSNFNRIYNLILQNTNTLEDEPSTLEHTDQASD